MALFPRETGGSDGGRDRPPIGTAETLALSVPMGMAAIDAVAAAAAPEYSATLPAQAPDSASSLTASAHPSALTKAPAQSPAPAHPPPENHSLERTESPALSHEPAAAAATAAPPPVFTPLRPAPAPEAEATKAAEEAAPPPVLKAKSGHGRSKQATGDEDNDHSLLHTDPGSEGSSARTSSAAHASEFAPITADILPLIPDEASPDAGEPASDTPIAAVPEPELPDADPPPEEEEPTGPDAAEPQPEPETPLPESDLPQPVRPEPNHAPELAEALTDQAADEDTTFTFTLPTGTFRDHEGDTILYSARLASGEPLPAWLSFNRESGTFSGTPAQSDAGSLEITVMAGDGFGGRTDTNFTLTVSPVNDAPTISGLSSSVTFLENTVNASAQVIDSSISLADVDSTDFSGGSLTVSYSSGGAAQDALSFDTTGGTISLAGGNVTVSGTVIGTLTSSGAAGANLTVSFNGNATPTLVDTLLEHLTYANNSDTPNAARTIQIALTDGDGGSVTATSIVNVTPESDNVAPVFTGTIPDQIAGVGIAFSYDAHGFFSDPDAGDTLTYSAQLDGGGALPGWLSIDANTGVLSGTPTGTGTYTLTVTATDGHGETVNGGMRLFSGTQVGTSGNDTFSGGAGNDVLLLNGLGIDSISNCGGGTDTLVVVGNITDPLTLNLIYAHSSIEILDASAVNQVNILGTSENNNLFFHGITTVLGSLGTIDGGDGNDAIYGANVASSGEYIIGGNGDDIIYGFAGNDTLVGGAGSNYLDGGAGDDVMIIGSEGTHHIGNAGGTDTVSIIGGINDDVTITISTIDSHTERLDASYVRSFNIVGTSGDNTIAVHGVSTMSGTLTSIDGGDGNDNIYGLGFSDRGEYLIGGNGNDTISGQAGNDTLVGGAGNDTLSGGTGDDVLVLDGQGVDYISNGGGSGTDTVSIVGGAGDDVIVTLSGATAAGGDLEIIDASSVNSVSFVGTSGNDAFAFHAVTTLSGSIDAIDMGDGDDTVYGLNVVISGESIIGGNGNDRIYGYAGNDTILGGDGNDTLQGGNENDSISGGDGADDIQGGYGNDTIDGGAGQDTLDGDVSGASADTFVFSDLTHSTDSARDLITDFVRGTDVINLSGMGLSFGDLTITTGGGVTTVEDDLSSFSFSLSGTFALDASDFVF